MTEVPLSVGPTYGDHLAWRWDRSNRRFVCEQAGHEIFIQFHKVGGRWSKTLPDGTPNPNGPKSYWTFELDRDRSHAHYKTAYEAKVAVVAEYKRRFR